MFSLKGKTAIVTGAAHGIGRAISQVFAEAGARVLLTDVDDEAGQAAAGALAGTGPETAYFHADVSSREQVSQAVKRASELGGGIDIVVANAAFLTDFNDVQHVSEEEWDQCVAVSLKGTHYLIQASLPYLLQRQGGSIIIMSSIMALVGGPNSAAYMAAKAGLLGFMRSVAYDYGRHNIRVNALCPGPIRTRISPSPSSPAYAWQVENTLLGRVGQPQDIAYAALYLASDEANFVTGVVFPVDGGFTAK